MSKVTKIETAARCLLVCAIFASPVLPAMADDTGGMQTTYQTQTLSQAGAPLFVQPNYEGDLRQHCFFAGDYTNPVQTSVGYNEQALQYWKNPVLQNPVNLHAPTPISTGLIGDNIDTTVQGSVPGLVGAAVTGAVVGASVIGGAASNIAANGGAAGASVGSSGVTQSVTGNVADGTQF